MTSGTFKSVPLSSITVNREARQRREITDVPELAESISRLGLIHPIVIDSDYNLVAGERRLAAVRSLGWTEVPCQFVSDLSDSDARAIELEENIKRVDITWQDRARAVREYHQLRKSEDPSWTEESTAAALGIVRETVNKNVAVAEALEKGDARVLDAPKFSTALGIIRREKERATGAFASSLFTPEDSPVINADFNNWAPAYRGPRFNFIHCDFPYGVGSDKFPQGGAATHGGYADTEETYWRLVETLCANLDRFCDDSAHLMFWFSMRYYGETLVVLRERTNFVIDPFPLIWSKSDNVGIIPDPERGPRRVYETCLFASRGDRKITSPVANGISLPSDREGHMSVKPSEVLRHFFRMFVDSSTTLLDPTCGSGSALRAADALGARSVCGLEINPEFYSTAVESIRRARSMRASA
jgi:ParB/RepB/Spo0J family partition protein